jgi:hypothetical protein
MQNQGSLRMNLRGHVVMSQSAMDGAALSSVAHAFSDNTQIPPGMYVLLSTGSGEARWTKTKDGQMVYYAYMNRPNAVWEQCTGPIHLLSTQHTFVERVPAVQLR